MAINLNAPGMARRRVSGILVEDGSENPPKNGEGTPPAGPKAAAPEGAQHRYEVGPGFEIALRAEAKHPVEVNLSKDGDKEHRHAEMDRRVQALEGTVRELAARLAKVEGAVQEPSKTA
jgi:hypothetical protein